MGAKGPVGRDALRPHAAVYYLVITIPLINWVASLEARLAVSEGGQAPPPTRRSRLFGSLFGRGGETPVIAADDAMPAAKQG